MYSHSDAGRTDAREAVDFFDGGSRGSYDDTFYRYLNLGMRVPFSTGTDWFMYDFSRVYVDLQGESTVEAWLRSLAAGRNYITNGPLLEFRVAGRALGETVEMSQPGHVSIDAHVRGRLGEGSLPNLARLRRVMRQVVATKERRNIH